MLIHPESKKSKAELVKQLEEAFNDENKKEVTPGELFKKFNLNITPTEQLREKAAKFMGYFCWLCVGALILMLFTITYLFVELLTS